MALSEKEQQKVVSQLNAAGINQCSACGKNTLEADKNLYAMMRAADGSVKPDGAVPLVVVACTSCHHIMTFSAPRLNVDIDAA